ncbi:YfhO family protein [Oligoflexia bacterium]|nr:YfhO family protein [Oligoflexia bacterium]
MENDSNTSLKHLPKFAALSVFLWPFVFYYQLVLPGFSFSRRIVNDFTILYYVYKVYLLEYLSAASIPLWSPFEGAGFPFFSNPFAQVFYPLNIPLLGIYLFLQEYPIYLHQIFAVLGVAIFALGLFLWLNLLQPQRIRSALFAALLISMSFKLGEILRLPNAIHTAAWIPWILYGITLAALSTVSFRKAGCLLFVATLMMLTGGYPYYVYYGIFLFPIYFVIVGIKPLRSVFFARKITQYHKVSSYFVRVAIPVGIAALLCAPYYLKTLQLLAQTTDRGGRDYCWAAFGEYNGFSFTQTLGALLFPPLTISEGWYYFGMIGVLLITCSVLGCLLKLQSSKKDILFLVITLLWFTLISYITYGEHSALFNFLWLHLPGFSQLRSWGRLNIMLLPIIALLLLQSHMFFERTLSFPCNYVRQRLVVIGLLIATTTAILFWQASVNAPEFYHSYWKRYFELFAGQELNFFYAAVSGCIALSLLMVLSLFWNMGKTWCRNGALALLLLVCAIELFPFSTQQWTKKESETPVSQTHVDLTHLLQDAFYAPRQNAKATLSLTPPYYNVGYLQNWHFRRYTSFHRRVFHPHMAEIIDLNELPAFQRLMGMTDGRKLFISKRLTHKAIRSFLTDVAQTEDKYAPQVQVIKYQGDLLEVKVTTPHALFLSFIDNWDPDWKVFVDGQPGQLKKLFGTFKSVALVPGTHKVIFKYAPFDITAYLNWRSNRKVPRQGRRSVMSTPSEKAICLERVKRGEL